MQTEISPAQDIQVLVAPLATISEGTRAREDYGDIEELKTSIKDRGLIQPLAVRRTGENSYLLLAGGRRFRACTELGLELVPIRIYNRDLTDDEMKLIELEENIRRKDMTWAEEITLKKQIHEIQIRRFGEKISPVAGSPEEVGWSKKATADFLGESAANISRDLELAKMIEAVPQLAQADTKNDAYKLIKKLGRQIEHTEIAEAAQRRVATTPLETLRKQIMNNYFICDCIEGMKKVPESSIDLVEIDPPYAIDLKNQKFCWNRGDKSHDAFSQEAYNEIDKDVYPTFIEAVFREAYRIMKPNSWILVWFGPDPWFQFIADTLKKVGFVGRMIPLIWSKGQGQTLIPATHLATSYEMCYYFRKGDPKIVKQGKINVFNYPITAAQKRIHPTERPVELLEDLLSTFTLPDSKICVPFLGSGNTIFAAYNMAMQAFGYDLSAEYRDAFCARASEYSPRAAQID